MSSKMKQWVALTVVGCLALLAAGWFLLVSPKRGEAAQVRDDVNTQASTNAGLQTQLATLKAQQKTVTQQEAKLAFVAAKIPDNPALPALIRALSIAADDAGVELVSLSPGSPVAVVAAAAPAGTPVGTPAAGDATTSSSSSTASKPVTLTSAGTASAATAGLLTSIPLTINVVGGYFQVEQFFDRLENLTRAAKVTGFTMVPGENPVKPVTGSSATAVSTGKTLTTNVMANVYMAVGRTSVPAVAAPVK
jgi:Tfp pilus assembly protein PilO